MMWRKKKPETGPKYYFLIEGLRGCYMPDNVDVIMAESQQELEDILNDRAKHLRDMDYVGIDEDEIKEAAAYAWNEMSVYGLTIPYGPTWEEMGFCIELQPTTKAVYESESDSDYI